MREGLEVLSRLELVLPGHSVRLGRGSSVSREWSVFSDTLAGVRFSLT